MIVFIKIVLILAFLALLILPFLPLRINFCYFKYDFKKKERYKNFPFAVAAFGVFAALMLLFPATHRLMEWFSTLAWIKELLSKMPPELVYSSSVFNFLLLNLLTSAVFLTVKFFLHRYLTRKYYPAAGGAKTKKNGKKTDGSVDSAKKNLSMAERLHQLREDSVLVFNTADGKETVPSKKTAAAKDQKNSADGTSGTKAPDPIPPEEESLKEKLRRWYFRLLGVFYHEDDHYATEKFSAFRWGRELRVFLLIVGCAYLLLAALLFLPVFFRFKADFIYKISNWLVDNMYLYPMAAIVFLHELCTFLSGTLKEADLPEDPRFSFISFIRREKPVDLNSLKAHLTDEFKEKYHIINIKMQTDDGSVYRVEDAAPAVKKIADSIKTANRSLNSDYIQGIDKMLQGENVLFDTSLYSGLGEYILRYLTIILSTGLRVLFICQNEKERKNAADYLSDGLKKVACTSRLLWRIETPETMHTGLKPDVLMLTPDDFLNENLYSDGRLFFEELTDVFVLDAEKVISHNNYFCLIIAKRLEQAVRSTEVLGDNAINVHRRKVNYRFLSNGHINNIDNSIQQYFNLEDRGLFRVGSFNSATEADLFVWSAGGDSTLMIDNSASQVALEVSIAQISSEHGVKNMNLISDTAVYGSQVTAVNGVALNRFDVSEHAIGYVIVADDKYNLPNAIYHYLRFSGRKASVLHIISKPYLLREYFLKNIEQYVSQYDLLSKCSNEHAEYRKSKLILLLCNAIRGVPVRDFLQQAEDLFKIPEEERENRESNEYVQYCIDLCLSEVCGGKFDKNAIHYRLERCTHVNREPEYYLFLINTDDIFSNILDDTKPIRFNYINTKSSEYVPIFRSALSQNFIVDQTFTHDNKSYTVKQADVEEGVLWLDDTSTTMNVPEEYLQTRKYRILAAERRNAIKPRFREQGVVVTAISIELYDSTVEADTIGYYEVSNTLKAINFSMQNGAVYHTLEEETRKQVLRNISTQVLRVHLEGDYPCDDGMRLLLAIVMQEFLKTLYPDSHKCLSVCPVLKDREKLLEDPDAEKLLDLYPEILENVLAEHFSDEDGLSFYIIEDIRNGNGIGKTLLEANGIVLTNMLHSVADFLSWGVEDPAENMPYLKFGYESFPTVLNVSGLEETLRQFCQDIRHVSYKAPEDDRPKCSFCLSPVRTSDAITLPDGRILCPDCRDKLVDSYKALEKLSRKVIETVKSSTAVPETIPEVTVSFVSTKELAEHCVSPDDAVPMAYCNHLTKEIFVEYGLPEIAMASCIARLITEIWQEYNISNDGSPRFEGQPLIVEIQTAYALLYRDYAAAKRGLYASLEGFTVLSDELKKAQTKDSFAYLLGKEGLSGNVFDFDDDDSGDGKDKGDGSDDGKDKDDGSDDGKDKGDGSDDGKDKDDGSDDGKDKDDGSDDGKDKDDGSDEGSDEDDSFASIIVERNPDKLYHYYFGKLDDQKQACYDVILNAIINFLPSADVSSFGMSSTEIFEICLYIEYDHPEVFWLARSGYTCIMGGNRKVTSVQLEYCFSKKEKEAHEKKLKKAVAPFLKGIKPTMSDYEVALRAHTNIVELIDYDSIAVDEEDMLTKMKKRRPAHFFDEIRSVYGVFVNKKAVCAGYAKAYQYLLNRLGIECAYVIGECFEGGWHAWNLVKLEGKYYYTDVTWDDSSNTKRSKSREDIGYGYFCITTDELKRTRGIDKESLFPVCTAVRCNYYHRSGLYFEEINLQTISRGIAPFLKKGDKLISMKFKNKEMYQAAYKKLFRENAFRSLLNQNRVSSGYAISGNETLFILYFYLS